MRHWLNARCLLVTALLVAAPVAALAHLALNWAPARLAVVRLSHTIDQRSQTLVSTATEAERLREQCVTLERRAAAGQAGNAWLPHRERDSVFDRLAEAFRDPGVSMDRLTLDEPGLYVATTRTNLLACERALVECTGAYRPLADCLDRLAETGLPLRIVRLNWASNGATLTLGLQIEIPFSPDESLACKLADAARLEDRK